MGKKVRKKNHKNEETVEYKWGKQAKMEQERWKGTVLLWR
jgi:hypothetical protein